MTSLKKAVAAFSKAYATTTGREASEYSKESFTNISNVGRRTPRSFNTTGVERIQFLDYEYATLISLPFEAKNSKSRRDTSTTTHITDVLWAPVLVKALKGYYKFDFLPLASLREALEERWDADCENNQLFQLLSNPCLSDTERFMEFLSGKSFSVSSTLLEWENKDGDILHRRIVLLDETSEIISKEEIIALASAE